MKSKKVLFALQAVLGIILIVLGGFVLTSDSVKMFSGLCIGLGSAMLALGVGWFIESFIISATEDEALKNTKPLKRMMKET